MSKLELTWYGKVKGPPHDHNLILPELLKEIKM